MNSQQAHMMLPLITEFANGKQIQFRKNDGSWQDTANPSFSFPPKHYRIKPAAMKTYPITMMHKVV